MVGDLGDVASYFLLIHVPIGAVVVVVFVFVVVRRLESLVGYGSEKDWSKINGVPIIIFCLRHIPEISCIERVEHEGVKSAKRFRVTDRNAWNHSFVKLG